jgi:hypothetical protein
LDLNGRREGGCPQKWDWNQLKFGIELVPIPPPKIVS